MNTRIVSVPSFGALMALVTLLGCAAADTGNMGFAALDGGDLGAETPDGAPEDDGSQSLRDRMDSAAMDASADAPSDTAADAPRVCAAMETCNNGFDDNCDGQVDERCPCLPGATQTCYFGPQSTAGVGLCVFGRQRCEGLGEFGLWTACADAVGPAGEACDGMDNDCDGVSDNGCACRAGETRGCYGGPMGTRGVGLCRDGMQLCFSGPGGIGSRWGDCTGDVQPARDGCDGIDNDCNGTVDDCCGCMMGATRRCYGGAMGTDGVGGCRAGTQTCVASCGAGALSGWGECAGQSLPAPEVCDGVDNDCNGTQDDGCACRMGETRGCYDGPMATRSVGTCRDGMQGCVAGPLGVGSVWGSCTAQRLPTGEVCDDGDNNCNGAVDESCACRRGQTEACYAGPMGTGGVGICRAGTRSCVVESGVARWAMCSGQTLPATESCDGIDNDCNGTVDNGCGCRLGETRGCYEGPMSTRSLGACADGSQSCVAGPSGVGTALGACTGQRLPSAELCDGIDNDCNGTVDNGCVCRTGETRGCYDGASSTRGVGLCSDGTQRCVSGTGAVGSAWGGCTGQRTPGTEACDNLDNDCDGTVDNGCACRVGETRRCYSGPAGSAGRGVCVGGTQTCVASGATVGWSTCAGELTPRPELCDRMDNDCEGTVDNGCLCMPGDTRSCYTGPTGTAGIGLCRAGSQSCVAGAGGVGSAWGGCTGSVLPGTETCNTTDDNCDGRIDEGCACTVGTSRVCYGGPAGTAGVGLCRNGMQSCGLASGVPAWGRCTGEVLPGPELCDGVDHDCNGTAGNGCACRAGGTQSCYTGPTGTSGVGICRAGSQSCVLGAGGVGSSWGGCTGEALPSPEICDGVDNTCNGVADEGCACRTGSTQSCYTGPTGTSGVGICRAGSQLCVAGPGGVGSSWGGCTGQVFPSSEVCDGTDNDCNGTVDNGCACPTGATQSCYTGPTGTSGVGSCRPGSQSCVAGSGGVGSSWGGCTGQVFPSSEVCDGTDNDCNGTVDNGCACPPGATQSCYTGPTGTSGVGICRAGSQSCLAGPGGVGSSWGGCTGETLPRTETCNAMDDNCNGTVDDGLSCAGPTVNCPAPRSVPAGTVVILTATATATAPASYRWEVISAPPGGSFTLGSPTSLSTAFASVIVGTFTLRFTVTDGLGRSASCTTTVINQGHGLRVELLWDQGVRPPVTTGRVDLDLHLHNVRAAAWFVDPDDCFFRNRNPRWDVRGSTADDPSLDTDNVYGFGPENVRIDAPVPTAETYSVGVHYYEGSPRANATVRIYCGESLVGTYNRALNGGVAASATADFWRVARVTFRDVSNCTVTAVDDVITFRSALTGSP